MSNIDKYINQVKKMGEKDRAKMGKGHVLSDKPTQTLERRMYDQNDMLRRAHAAQLKKKMIKHAAKTKSKKSMMVQKERLKDHKTYFKLKQHDTVARVSPVRLSVGTMQSVDRVRTIGRTERVRSSRDLGSGGPIPNKELLTMKLSHTGKTAVNMGVLPEMFFRRLFTAIYNDWADEMIPYIQRIVPKDSGDLLGSILINIGTPEIKSDRLIIKVGANVPYAKYVQKMRSNYVKGGGPAVRHGPGMGPSRRNISSRTGNVLYDPQASHDFMYLITKNSEKVLKKVISDVLKELIDDELFNYLKVYVTGFTRRHSLIRYSMGRV